MQLINTYIFYLGKKMVENSDNGADGNNNSQQVNYSQPVKKPIKMGRFTYIISFILVLFVIGIVYYLLAVHEPSANVTNALQTGTVSHVFSIINITNNTTQQTNQAYLGYVNCTPAGSEFSCNASSMIHSYSIILPNETLIVNGTFIDLILTQYTGSNWTNVSLSFVPKGTPSYNGVPEVNFTSHSSSIYPIYLGDIYNSIYLGDIYNGQPLLATLFPISKRESGNFSGQVWAQYYEYGSITPKYTLIGNLAVDAIAYVPPSIKSGRSTISGTCKSTYADYKCSNPALTLYENYTPNGQLVASGNLTLNITSTTNLYNMSISILPIIPQEGIYSGYCGTFNLPNILAGQVEELNLSVASGCFDKYIITNTTPLRFYLFISNNTFISNIYTNTSSELYYNINLTVYPSVYPVP